MNFMKGNKQTFAYGRDNKLDNYIRYRNRSIITSIIILATFFFFFRNRPNQSIYVLPEEDSISITSHTGEKISIRYSSITSIELSDSIDLGKVVEGTDTGRVASGLWKNDVWGEYHLFILPKVKNYIILTTQDDRIVFNCESDSVTEELYNAFYDLMNQKGFAGQIRFLP